NAQYIQKNRWLLHTSLLWDYTPDKMGYLLLPKKRPAYRQDRSHTDFLSPLHPYFPSKADLISQLADNAQKQLRAENTDIQEALSHLNLPHRSATIRISVDQ
ncbi:lipoate--protein ligase family protein, partial [Chlamydiota bacterium]